MASSGTLSLSIGYRFKPERGREEVIIAGKVRTKSSASIEARDFSLRTIKHAVITPYYTGEKYPLAAYGSINNAGSLMNTLNIYNLTGSNKEAGTPVHTQPTHFGTVAFGTMSHSFMIIGA